MNLQILMLIYALTVKPMYDKLSQFYFLLNELCIYWCASLTFSFTDYTYIDVKKYDIGQLWIGLIITTLILNGGNLVFTVVYRAKIVVEHWLEVRKKQRVVK